MNEALRRFPPWVHRAWDVPLVIAMGALDLLIWGGDRELLGGGLLPLWVVPAATIVVCGALLVRRRYPLVVFGLLAAFALVNVVVPRYQPFACLLVAVHAVATRCSPRQAGLALVACTVPFGLFSYQAAVAKTTGLTLGGFLQTATLWSVVVGLVWGLGRLSYVRELRARETERRLEAEAEAALEAERLRLARELHDSVTGSVTAMILHAAGARARLTDGPVHDALAVVEQAGTQAMNELHRMLGLLRAPDGSTGSPNGSRPDLSALDELADRARKAGLAVTVTSAGASRQLDPSVDQAAYRIVQESLTNATKHAGPGACVEVCLAWRSEDLHIDVHSAGGAGPRAVPSSGHGLLGLHERVHLVGGTLAAGPDRGGWSVHAELPLAGAPEATEPAGSVGPVAAPAPVAPPTPPVADSEIIRP